MGYDRASLSPMPAQGAVPAGWKLVPIEPTPAMIDAYLNLNLRFHSATRDWSAMLAAAPFAPAEPWSEMDYGGTMNFTVADPAQGAAPVQAIKVHTAYDGTVAAFAAQPTGAPAEPGEKALREAFGAWANTMGNGELSLLDVLSPAEQDAEFDKWKIALLERGGAWPTSAPAETSADALGAAWKLLQEAYDYGQFADDFDRPQIKPVRSAIRIVLTAARTQAGEGGSNV